VERICKTSVGKVKSTAIYLQCRESWLRADQTLRALGSKVFGTLAATRQTRRRLVAGLFDYLSLIGGTPPRHVLPKGVKPQRAKRFSIRGAYR
jgi:hypothetical protein